MVAGTAPFSPNDRLHLAGGLYVLRIRHPVRDDRGFERDHRAAQLELLRDFRMQVNTWRHDLRKPLFRESR